MFSNTRTNTSPTGPSAIHSTARKHAHSSSSSTPQPTSKRVKYSIKDQRRDLTQSIISKLPRDELERLLIDAALGDERTMQEVIKANSVKRAPVTSQEHKLDVPGTSNWETGVGVEEHLINDSEAKLNELLDLEEDRKSREVMEVIRGMEEDKPLQFYHVTQRQFEARKAKMMDDLGRSSDAEAPL